MKVLLISVLCAICVAGVSAAGYVQKYFDQKIDHFNFVTYGDQTYKQRYLYNDTWWDKNAGAVFFYAGNEGDVVNFWNNSGFVFRAAQQFKALVVFAEHRYYGESLPFGNDSFSPEKIGFLSIEQALADYAFFLTSFKQQWKIEKHPVVAFGGSYGGQLAAYMRFKYPNIIIGAIAASAPLYQVAGLTNGDQFFQAVTKDFRRASADCEPRVRAAYSLMNEWYNAGRAGLDKISKAFHLCKPLGSTEDYIHFLLWSRNAFVMAAMTDYPYPATFMGNFPAFPVNVMCQRLSSSVQMEIGLFSAVSLFYNTSGTAQCYNIYDEYIRCADPTGCGLGFDSMAWDYQVCTEINLECSSNGVMDMFPALPFTAANRDEYCQKRWKVRPRRDLLKVIFWGADINSSSNIVFSNGNLDPWAQGGILQQLSDSLVVALVDGGAHHLDLREDNPDDPVSVRDVRNFELQQIAKWLDQYHTNTVI